MIIPDLPLIAIHFPKSITRLIDRRRDTVVPAEATQEVEVAFDHKAAVATNDNFIKTTLNSFTAALESLKARKELDMIEGILKFEKEELSKFWNDLVEDFGISLSDLFSLIVVNDNSLQTSSGAVFHVAPIYLMDNKDEIRQIINITMSVVYKYFYEYRNEFLNRDIKSFLSYLDGRVYTSFIISESGINDSGDGLLVPNNVLGLRGKIVTYSFANRIRILQMGVPTINNFIDAINRGSTWSASAFMQSLLSSYAAQKGLDPVTADLLGDPENMIQYITTPENKIDQEMTGLMTYALMTARLLNTIYARHYADDFPFKNITPENYINVLAPFELALKYNALGNFKDPKLINSFVQTDQHIQQSDDDESVIHQMKCLDKENGKRYNMALIVYYSTGASRQYSNKDNSDAIHNAILGLIGSCVAYEYHKRELGLL